MNGRIFNLVENLLITKSISNECECNASECGWKQDENLSRFEGMNDTLTACSAAVSLAKRRQPLRDIRGHQLRYS